MRVDMMKKKIYGLIYQKKKWILPITYNQLFPKLSPKEESDEWFSSLQYLNVGINDLSISELFLNPGSEFGAMNNAAINALGWKADKLSDFDIKSNFKHIIESLKWFTDMPVSIKNKDSKTVTATGNFTHINNGKPESMLYLGMTWIQKVQVKGHDIAG
ncbi:4142_t:CDS:2 [Acaulospora morrowiae]|uniref:4142_t:CDS:1 n=1 Tax=Acaulospora morrowiae TaxID=94023 RepID=A0A9N9A555_9GLOM|nr:4142_t:CDS:2 [Acaulospora morrowiae]